MPRKRQQKQVTSPRAEAGQRQYPEIASQAKAAGLLLACSWIISQRSPRHAQVRTPHWQLFSDDGRGRCVLSFWPATRRWRSYLDGQSGQADPDALIGLALALLHEASRKEQRP